MARQDQMVGTVIDGRYQLLAPLGEGGMGVVYQARHVALGRVMAIKILRDAQDEQAEERFRREAKACSAIEHENIVAITDFGVLPDNRPYLVMEFLQGPTLSDILRGGALPTVRALQIGLQIARGLVAVHDKNIIHRDLKPENVFVLSRQGQDLVKIVDFGLAQVQQSARLTAYGMVMGTPYYISPEQASGGAIDARCDQYALGCMLFEMLTGTRPFQDESPAIVMKQHVVEFPPSLRERRPDLVFPDELEALVARLFLKDPEQRFANTHDLEDVLQQAIDRLLQAPTARPLSLSGVAMRRVQLFFAAVLLCLGSAGLVFGYMQSAKKRRRALVLQSLQSLEALPPSPPPVPAVPAARPAPIPSGPTLNVRFAVARPARAVTISCTPDIKQLCSRSCTVTIPAGAGLCTASAEGFGSQAFAYDALRTKAHGKHGARQKVALVAIGEGKPGK